VASAVSECPKILEHKKSALLARDRLLTDRALGRRLGAAAKARMEQEFSAEAAVRRFKQLYQRLAHRESQDQSTIAG